MRVRICRRLGQHGGRTARPNEKPIAAYGPAIPLGDGGEARSVMTIAISDSVPRLTHGFDSTKLVLYGFAAVLCVLIVLPMSWLVYYGFTDKDGGLTLAEFRDADPRSDAVRAAGHDLYARDARRA